MAIFNQNHKEIQKAQVVEDKKTKVSAMEILLQSNAEILTQLNEINQKIEAVDRNNKKFLMTASMNKTAELEKKVFDMKKGVIALLDQIDMLTEAVYKGNDDKLKAGLEPFAKSIRKILSEVGIKEIEVSLGEEFNAEIHECVEIIATEQYENDKITGLVRRGYSDLDNGRIIRAVQVTVNKK